MTLSAQNTLWTIMKVKVCFRVLLVIGAVTIFLLDKRIPPSSGILRSLKLPSIFVHECSKPSYPGVHGYKAPYADVLEYFKASSLDVPKLFKPLVIAEEYREMQDLVRTFSAALKNASLTYFLIQGSLLGSWRHHGLVPWDDDVDVAVLYKETESVHTVLGNLTPHYYVVPYTEASLKFYSSRGQKAGDKLWNWPFLDITAYKQNSTHVWDPYYTQVFYPIIDVFPLRERPFMGMMLSAPKDTEAMLTRYFQTSNLTLCKPTKYDHRRELWTDIDIDKLAVPCKQLHSVYPFVWRQPARGGLEGCNESLVTNSSVLSWLVLNTTRC